MENVGAQAGIGMGANLLSGEQDLSDALKGAGVSFLSQAGSGYVANEIGSHFANSSDPLIQGVHKAAHGLSAAAFAGAGAAALNQDVETAIAGAATGAMISEIVAEALANPLKADVGAEIGRQRTELGRDLTEAETRAIWNSKIEDIAQIARVSGSLSGAFSGSVLPE